MTTKIQEIESSLNHEELDFFIKVWCEDKTHVVLVLVAFYTQGNISLEKNPRVKPYDWLPDQGWEDVMKLTTTHSDIFGSLANDIEKSESSWKKVLSTYSY